MSIDHLAELKFVSRGSIAAEPDSTFSILRWVRAKLDADDEVLWGDTVDGQRSAYKRIARDDGSYSYSSHLGLH